MSVLAYRCQNGHISLAGDKAREREGNAQRVESSITDPERELMMLALRIASTYCNIAEADVIAGHRDGSQRVLSKARREIASVEGRLKTNQGWSETERDTALAYVAELKERIDSLNRLAA